MTQSDETTSLYDAFIEDARELIDETLNEPIDSEDEVGQEVYMSRVLDKAADLAVVALSDTIDTIIRLIYEMAKLDRWRYLPEEFNSLEEWASVRFDSAVKSESITTDYIYRFCSAARRLLVPLNKQPVIDQVTGEKIDGDILIQKIGKQDLKELPFFFQTATDKGHPDLRDELIIAVNNGEKRAVVEEIKKRIKAAPVKGSTTKTDPDPPTPSKPKIYISQDGDTVRVKGEFPSIMLGLVEVQLSQFFDIEWSYVPEREHDHVMA
jgi:hypothetical protein